MNYDDFAIETFEAGKGLWHARIRRADLKPVVIDGVSFPTMEVGFAWSSPDAAVKDAKAQIDWLNRRGATAGQIPQAERSVAQLFESGLHPMPESEAEPIPSSSAAVRSNCPQCNARLAILRVITGRSGSEYWTLRCTRCGGIHLDIVKSPSPSPSKPLT